MIDPNRHSNIAFLVGYLILFYLLGLMFWEYLSSIIFAGILAGTFLPLNRIFIKKFKISQNLSALIVCLIIIASVFVPAVFLAIRLGEEAYHLYLTTSAYVNEETLNSMMFQEGWMQKTLRKIFQLMSLDYNAISLKNLILDSLKNASTVMINIVNDWLSNIIAFIIQFIIMVVVIFAFLVDGEKIKKFVLDLSPLPDDEEELVLEKFNQMNYVTLVGNGIGGVIQGVLAGIGFWVVGIESVFLWTTAMVILAFIPMVGISVIYIPACIYLFIADQTIGSVVLFIYCTVIAVLVENWFKPKFVGNRVKINSTFVFLSIIGGMSVFGIPGIFYGPLIISIFLTFVSLYHKRYSNIPQP
ncbi:MAG: AI-2E family transporter [Deltaproteobacteria bacterium]|nr:AI-2E family transporter [Deltaproteobacteria bacterium]